MNEGQWQYDEIKGVYVCKWSGFLAVGSPVYQAMLAKLIEHHWKIIKPPSLRLTPDLLDDEPDRPIPYVGREDIIRPVE